MTLKLNRDPRQRFDEKVTRSDSCWNWVGGLTGSGYGMFWIHGRERLAHILSYEWHVGPVPAGLELDHTCRNTACVRPDHLEPVTHKENMRRADIALGIRSAATQCPHGHPYDEANTSHRNGRRHCKACARIRAARNYRRRLNDGSAA